MARPSRPSATREFADYVATGAGMALSCSSYAMLGSLSTLVVGPWLLLVTGLAALLCLIILLAIGELAGMYPTAPGIRTYTRTAFGDTSSVALTILVLLLVALFAPIEVSFFLFALQPLMPEIPHVVVIGLVLTSLVAFNLAGLEVPRRLQRLLTVIVVSILCGVSLAALAWSNETVVPRTDTLDWGLVGRVLSATGAAIFLYTGTEWITPLGRRPASYERLVPWSMPAALAVLLLVFLLLGAAIDRIGASGSLALAGSPQVAVGAAVFPGLGIQLMLLISALSMLTTFNAGLMGASRLVYALAREQRLPRWGAALSRRTGAPIGGLACVSALSVIACAVILPLRLQVAAALVCAAIYCVVYACFVGAAIRLRRLAPGMSRPFTTPVPLWCHLVVVAALPTLAVAVLLSDPQTRTSAPLLFAACLLVSAAGARVSVRRAVAIPPRPLPLR